MSFSDKPPASRASRAPRKPRARISLKMQAIGFLSRREHSRQELRAKLLDSLRKRAREEAALVAASEKAAQELAEALRQQPSNGIDDAFAPTMPAPAGLARGVASTREARAPAPRERVGSQAGDRSFAERNSPLDRSALETLSLASGAPLPVSLKASLAAAAASSPMPASGQARVQANEPSPRRTPAQALEAFDEFVDVDAEHIDPSIDDLPTRSTVPLAASDLELSDPEAAVDQLLDWLVANKYLSETRFVESRVNARSRKQGALLIKLELSRHGLALEPEQAATLRETEFARAQALWQRKFGEVAPDARARAKQARFLAARGFAADIVRRVVGGDEEF